MKVLVLSDTHIPAKTKKLPEALKKAAQTSDCCLHAGDFTTYSVFEALNALVKTYGVCGNMDNNNIKEKLPEKQIIELGEVTLGLTHGRGHPNNLINCVNNEFSREFARIDIFVFGHSHYPFDQIIKGKIYFNPGSVTDTIIAPYLSYGILEIDGKNIKRRIVKIG